MTEAEFLAARPQLRGNWHVLRQETKDLYLRVDEHPELWPDLREMIMSDVEFHARQTLRAAKAKQEIDWTPTIDFMGQFARALTFSALLALCAIILSRL